MVNEELEGVVEKLREFQARNIISAFSVSNEEGKGPRIWLSWVGHPKDDELSKFIEKHHIPEKDRVNLQREFYFFASDFNEVRPGSGLIRVFGGKSEGPGGTLTCLLSPKGGTDIYFAAASHVLTDFWQDTASQGSIYRYRPGFPPTGSKRFLGKVLYFTKAPKFHKNSQAAKVDLDVAIVKLDGDAEPKERTTCYGTFGEWPPGECCKIEEGMHVVKCGSQETHWTEAVVEVPSQADTTIYGPKGECYILHNQIILRDLTSCEALQANCPKNDPKTPFAVPGDSGTMVVVKETKRPVGMLIAGSILDGLYVVTPFSAIQEFFDEKRLVMQRA